jgi:monoamine oxidase
MARRTFLAASLSGLAAVVLASCTGPEPTPTPVPSPTPTPTPTPTPPVGGVPAPTAMARSQWGTDPFARGAFSYDAVGTTPELRRSLAEPVGERLWIAGEACSAEAPGTLHGARDSGLSAAEQLARIAEPGERVAVIGAGLAGLTAAAHLVDAGFEVVVVEARERLGGRIDSVDADGFDRTVELGPVFVGDDEAFQEALAAASVDTVPFDADVEARTADGIAVDIPSTGVDAIGAARDWALANGADVSLADALVAAAIVPLPTAPGPEGVSPAAWLAHAISSGVEPATGATSALVSARADALAEPSDDRSGDRRLVTGRLADLVDELADGVDIAVSSVVTRIAYDERRVSLRLDSGESLTADRAILTVPLGVLKSDTLRFSPALPFAHQRAIARLQTGTVDTVWLRFDEAFWRADAAAEPDGEAAGRPGTTADVLTVVARASRVAAWIDVGRATGEPVLVAVIAATQATRLEQLDDEELQAAILADLAPYATTTG